MNQGGHPLLDGHAAAFSPPLPSSGVQPPPSSAAAASVEPLDYEEYVLQQRRLAGGAPVEPRAAHLVEFPRDDIEVKVVPRKIRTMGHVQPEEPM